jgi:hypothetical protein
MGNCCVPESLGYVRYVHGRSLGKCQTHIDLRQEGSKSDTDKLLDAVEAKMRVGGTQAQFVVHQASSINSGLQTGKHILLGFLDIEDSESTFVCGDW